ncbi:MAG: methylated-DNA--[protein]-cysteine S-methyltransferase [Mycobacterium sp.]
MITNIFDKMDGEDATLARLHDRLVHDADSVEVLDIAYRTIDTPVGTLLLAATAAGLVRVAYDVEGHDAVLTALANRVSPRVLHAPGRLDDAAHQIDEYFAKTRTAFEMPVDLRLTGGFRRTVIEHLRDIGYGRRESYAAVATAIGHPRAVRAVGTACAHNPLPVVIPCHRVVRSDGATGQYVGGPLAKSALLSLEAAQSGNECARGAVEHGHETRRRRP